MKKTSLLLVLAILLSLFSACETVSNINQPRFENLTDLVPSSANLMVSGKLSEFVTDPDFKALAKSLARILDPAIDLDVMVAEVKEHTGIDMTAVNDALLFVDITTVTQQSQPPYLGLLLKGTFKQDAILSVMKGSSGQRFSSKDYNGHTIYYDTDSDWRFVFLGSNVMVMGTLEEVIKNIIDTSEGSKPSISGSILENYGAIGDTLVRGVIKPPAYLMQLAILGSSDAPFAASRILNLDLATLSIQKTGNILTTRVSAQYPTAEAATQAEPAIRDGLSQLKGNMPFPRDASLAALTDKLLGKVQVNRGDLKVNLVFEITTSEIMSILSAYPPPTRPVYQTTAPPPITAPPTMVPTVRPPTATPFPLPKELVLISPDEGALLDNGRFDGYDRIIWNFDWSDVPGATQYQIYVIGDTSPAPTINTQISYSNYHWENYGSIGGGNVDQNRFGWTWKVRALVNGVWSGWSQRTFNVEPVDTDPRSPIPITVPPPTTSPPTSPVPTATPTPVPPTLPPPTITLPPAPILISPASGAVLDNGRYDGRDNIVWEFDWSDTAGVNQYQIYVVGPDGQYPVINYATTSSYYGIARAGYIADSNRVGWVWKVRGLVNGVWSGWSQRTFNVEPVDTDPQVPVPVPSPTTTPPPPTITPTPTTPPPTTSPFLTLRFATSLMPTSSEYLAVYKPMLDEIEQRSSGRIKFNVIAGASAADQYNIITAGVVDMGVTYFSYIVDRFPLSDAFAFPAAYSMTNICEDLVQSLGNRIFALAPSETKVLGFFQQQPYFLYTASKPVRTLDDVKGLKLRAAGSMQGAALTSLGAVPISLTSADLYEAIQRGLIDGALATPSMADSFRLTEVTKHAFRLPLGYTVGMIHMNANSWSRIPDDLKPIFEEVCGRARYNFVQQFNTDDAKVNSILTGLGGAVYTPAAADLFQWANAIKPVIDNWISTTQGRGLPANDMVNAIRVECQKQGILFPY
ncbi:MAG: TRAP transporter substrate-binding protein DctP [Chloroflexota bacterium]